MDHKFEEPILTVFTVLNPLEIEKKRKTSVHNNTKNATRFRSLWTFFFICNSYHSILSYTFFTAHALNATCYKLHGIGIP